MVNLDKLTYAGNPANVADVADDEAYRFVHADIADAEAVAEAIAGVDAVVNFAAESHVDRSILDPSEFISTDVVGTAVLLDAARRAGVGRFVQVSTDEVYGSIPTGAFRETDPISPSSPYSASKAGGRPPGARVAPHLRARRGHHPRLQHLRPAPVPREADPALRHQRARRPRAAGLRRRDAGARLDPRGRPLRGHLDGPGASATAGEVYNVGGGNEEPNMEITRRILALTGRDEIADAPRRRPPGPRPPLRPRHRRACARLGWEPRIGFEDGLTATVAWYRDSRDWWEPIKSGEYRRYYEEQYGSR